MQVLSTVPILFSYWAEASEAYDLSQFLNNHIADIVVDSPEKFIGLGTVPMQDTKLAIREIERCMGDLGMKGIEIGTNINGENLGEQKFRPIFEAAAEMGCAIFVHPWDMMGEDQMQKYWLPWLVGMPAELSRAICSLIFSGVIEQLPNLRITFAHGGGSYPWTMGRIEHGFNVRPDLCAIDNPKPPSEYNGRMYFDSLVHDADALRFLINRFGADSIAMGSDYPFPLGEEKPGELIESMDDLSGDVKKQLLSGTALEWLGMESVD
jgi:aminocarboxymuconate-semialdehyde decarboxylase